jgi:hypothetical protein
MTALKINEHLLPRVIFNGFNITIKLYQILPVVRSLCDDGDFIILFATNEYIDRTADDSICAMTEQFPEVVARGERQFQTLQQLGQTIWQ